MADENSFYGIDCARFGDSIDIILDREIFEHKSILKQYDEAVTLYRMIYNSMNRLGKSSSQIAKDVGFGKNKTLKLLVALEEKGYVTKLGNGRGIKYLIKS